MCGTSCGRGTQSMTPLGASRLDRGMGRVWWMSSTRLEACATLTRYTMPRTRSPVVCVQHKLHARQVHPCVGSVGQHNAWGTAQHVGQHNVWGQHNTWGTTSLRLTHHKIPSNLATQAIVYAFVLLELSSASKLECCAGCMSGACYLGPCISVRPHTPAGEVACKQVSAPQQTS